jgi:hypothetical protein
MRQQAQSGNRAAFNGLLATALRAKAMIGIYQRAQTSQVELIITCSLHAALDNSAKLYRLFLRFCRGLGARAPKLIESRSLHSQGCQIPEYKHCGRLSDIATLAILNVAGSKQKCANTKRKCK